ncbi:hypothetical protein DIPPA_26765 [Diplonema papillatum]|nr:hypothetical protein DIPPA_26765 [Diplonema papillatum]
MTTSRGQLADQHLTATERRQTKSEVVAFVWHRPACTQNVVFRCDTTSIVSDDCFNVRD